MFVGFRWEFSCQTVVFLVIFYIVFKSQFHFACINLAVESEF